MDDVIGKIIGFGRLLVSHQSILRGLSTDIYGDGESFSGQRSGLNDPISVKTGLGSYVAFSSECWISMQMVKSRQSIALRGVLGYFPLLNMRLIPILRGDIKRLLPALES